MANFKRWPVETPILIQTRDGWQMAPAWQRAFTNNGAILDEFFDELEMSGGIEGLPFTGVLGDGHHGNGYYDANATLTDDVPVYQFENFRVASGVTLTAKQQNPGGIVIAVRGTAEIAGTIDCSGLGGKGASASTVGGNGKTGWPGFNWAGMSGSGGGSDINPGGESAPVRLSSPYGVYSPADNATSTGSNQWGFGSTAATIGHIRQFSGEYVVGALAGGTATNNGNSGSSFATLTASWGSSADAVFNTLWAFYRRLAVGWGAGGGSGGGDASNASGAAGAGGGYCLILASKLSFTGTVNCSGDDAASPAGGNAGGSGGGGGGLAVLGYRNELIANTGSFDVAGGAGSSGSGTGGDGGTGGSGYSRVFDMRI